MFVGNRISAAKRTCNNNMNATLSPLTQKPENKQPHLYMQKNDRLRTIAKSNGFEPRLNIVNDL